MSRTPGRALLVMLVLVLSAAGNGYADVLDDLARATVALQCNSRGSRFLGTGVVVHESGYILTSTSVVPPDGKNIRARFLGGGEVSAELVATDPRLELSVVKVARPPAGVRVVPLRHSADVRVGEAAFSYGDAFYTFGDSGTFTASLGIVSGRYSLTRQMTPPGKSPLYVGEVFETTATMAPGMDGGPLLDAAGRMIGLLSLNLSDARWLGVAIPSDVLLGPLNKAIETHARARKSSAGVTVVDGPAKPIFPEHQRRTAALTKALDAVAPSVVAIETVRHSSRGDRLPRIEPIGPYSAIVKRPNAPVTGLIVGSDGEILTSHFNVSGNLKSIHVVLPDGRRLAARRLGWDVRRDLAMLKVDARDLPAAKLVEVDMPLGMPLAAVGRSPDPASATITIGIVSAVGRFDSTAVQIDARTNYGNAGGPVIDRAGRCIGLVTHVRHDSMWSQNSGVGFATVARSINQVLPRLRAGEVIAKPKKGFLGVRAGSAGLDAGGVRIQAVVPDSGAKRAGLRVGDVITHVDGQAVGESRDLTRLILRRKPNDVVTLTIRRGKTTKTIKATLGVHPDR